MGKAPAVGGGPEGLGLHFGVLRALSSDGESASFTPRRSGVRAPQRPPQESPGSGFCSFESTEAVRQGSVASAPPWIAVRQ